MIAKTKPQEYYQDQHGTHPIFGAAAILVADIDAHYDSGDVEGALDEAADDLATHAALSGAGVHGSSVGVAANTIPHRNAYGELFGNYFNMAANLETSQPAEIVGIWYGGDGFLRKQTFAKFKEHLRDFIYPVGSYYTQYPDAASNDDATEFPTSQRPETLFGGTWAEQWPTESVYFRTRGTLSDTGRASGKQGDQFQGHKHSVGDFGNTSGIHTSSSNYPGPTYDGKTGLPVADGINDLPRTGTETRVVNRRIKVWKRTA